MEKVGTLDSSEKNDRYPRRVMVAKDGAKGRGYDKQKLPM